ncbi:hypothetical protein KJ937_00850 [Patescibacteria group bacterium]|nr:hypothetical protein [Patescibacteria group bacterium]MBU2508767.1 hypothetical protein [Patescibacteria group bacterium]
MFSFTRFLISLKSLWQQRRFQVVEQEPLAQKKQGAVQFSSLPKETQEVVMKSAAKRFWKDYGSVIERLANE